MLNTLDGRRRGEYCERLDELILYVQEVYVHYENWTRIFGHAVVPALPGRPNQPNQTSLI